MATSQFQETKPRWVGGDIKRVDATEKATGKTVYGVDTKAEGMLWAKVLRSKYPHAKLRRIDASKAEKCQGVVKVLTRKDVDGTNLFGTYVIDQPILCDDKVRFAGDPVAVVVAESLETAQQALSLIDVEYGPLPVLSDPQEALKKNAVKIHSQGNILREEHIRRGDVDEAFGKSSIVVENTYYASGRQMPAYMETESGIGYLDGSGTVVLEVSTQSPYEDQVQLARALGIPKEKIRVIATAVGGGFGGKCDLTVQGHLALAALKTKRPVKMVWTREESILMCYKRHPTIVEMKTGVDGDGKILGHKAKIIADTGAYASRGPSVLAVEIEASCGPYRIQNIDIEAYCVYTNNGMSGALNGFGEPQLTFALEQQLEIIAEKLGLDPFEIRERNAVKQGDRTALGHLIEGSCGFPNTLEAAKKSELWLNRLQLKSRPSQPWRKRGVAIACAEKGAGFQNNVQDLGSASIEISPSGTFDVALSCPEIGQGNITAFLQMAAEALESEIEHVRVITGDSLRAPNTGSSIASRSIFVGGNAIIQAAAKIKELLVATGAAMLKLPVNELICRKSHVVWMKNDSRRLSYREIADRLYNRGVVTKVEACFLWPRHYDSEEPGRSSPVDFTHAVYSYGTEVVLVEVDTLTGKVDVLDAVAAVDCGRVINPAGLEGQVECDTAMGLGYALFEDVIMENGYVKTTNLTAYTLPTAIDTPNVTTISVGVDDPRGPFGAKAAGELVISSIGTAVANAIFDAVGVRMFQLPFTPERVLEAMNQHKKTRQD